jgi:predicted signal transduction protein with EAL and GGDEF domain
MLARLGGDEFALLRPAVSSRAESAAIGAEIEAILRPGFEIFGNLLHVTVSCGICRGPQNGKDAGTILRNADIAMYEAKQAGRNCWRVFSAAMDASLRWRHEVETALRHAITADQLTMAYQPIVHAENGKIASFEALLRWDHPEKGPIGPAVFVPIAEQCGLMGLLGSWVINRVFHDSKAWPETEISINLSPLQVTAQGFLAELRRHLRETGANPRRIVFEITEGVLLDSNAQVMGVLEQIKAMGFRIALDDFGTGYSSLSYLRAFKFDLIKVDRSLVQHIENDLNSQSILKAIVALGKSLRMKVVAEGVETLLQRQLVQSAGCQLIQGNYHWPALTQAEAGMLIEPAQAPRLAKTA